MIYPKEWNGLTPYVKVLIVLFLFCLPTRGLAEDDFQYRQLLSLKVIDTKKVDLVFFNQMRLNHNAQDVSFYLMSPQLKFDFWKNLQLGLNYTHLNFKAFNAAAGREEFRFHHRLELEVNPHWDIGEHFKVSMRNRYEFRWIENIGSDRDRFRHRTNVEVPFKNVLPLQAIFANSEFFYDFVDHRYNENWTVPFGLKFKVNEHVNFSIFYMLQSRVTDTWTSTQILGTHLMVNF